MMHYKTTQNSLQLSKQFLLPFVPALKLKKFKQNIFYFKVTKKKVFTTQFYTYAGLSIRGVGGGKASQQRTATPAHPVQRICTVSRAQTP